MLSPCVVFDLDDTLFLERDYVLSGIRTVGQHVSNSYGIAGFTEAASSLFERGIRGNTFDLALREVGADPTKELVDELVVVYRTHVPSITLLPDAQTLINSLAGGYLGVVTDGPVESQRQKAEVVGASVWATLVIFTSELGTEFVKPHPLGFALHEEKAKMHGSEFTYIADNPSKDFKAPRSRGWKTIRIRRPLSLHRALDSGNDVDSEVESLDELGDWRMP